jgi:hypothetical protein
MPGFQLQFTILARETVLYLTVPALKEDKERNLKGWDLSLAHTVEMKGC